MFALSRIAALSFLLGGTLSAQPQFDLVGPFPVEGYGTFFVGNGPQLVSGDWNEDGALDLAVSRAAQGSVRLLLGDGLGSFTPSVALSVGSTPLALVTDDVNGDGHADLLTANAGTEDVSVLLGDGTGAFVATPPLPVGMTWSLALIHANPDPAPDLLVAEFNATPDEPGSVHLFLNDGSGGFLLENSYPVGVSPAWMRIGDLNEDGNPDAVVTSFGVIGTLFGEIHILYGDGAGGFTVETVPALGYFSSVELTDVDGDGHLDIAVHETNDIQCLATLWVFRGDGAGNWAFHLFDEPDCGPIYLAASDFDEDAQMDLVITNPVAGGAELWFYLGVTEPPWAYPLGQAPGDLLVEDFDGDARPDLAVMDAGEEALHVLLNRTVPPVFIRGDVNVDGVVDVADPVAALAHLFEGAAVPCAAAVDTNDDGASDISDPVYLLNHLFVSGPAPPPPFPDCGEDPTGDAMSCYQPPVCP